MGLIGEIYEPVIAILPIGDHYTMGPRQAAYAARLIGAPEIVPGHYGTFGAADRHAGGAARGARAHRRAARRCTRGSPARSCGPSGDVLDRRLRRGDGEAAGRRRRVEVPRRRRGRAVARGRGRRDRDAGAREHALRARRARAPARRARAPREALDARAGGRRRAATTARRASSTPAARAATHTGRALHGLGRRAHGRRLRRAGQHPHRRRTSSTRWPRPTRPAAARSPSACSQRWPPATRPAATAAAASRRRSSSSRPAAATAATTTAWSTCASTTTADPVPELRRLYDIHILLTGTTPEEQKLPLEGALADEVRELLAARRLPERAGRRRPRARRCARSSGTENLEARWWHEERLDPVVLEHLRAVARARLRADPPSVVSDAARRRRWTGEPGRALLGRGDRRRWRRDRHRRALEDLLADGARRGVRAGTRMRCAMHGSKRLRTCLTATSAALSSSAAAWAQRNIESSARGEAPTSTSGCSRVERSRRTR